MCNFLSAIVTRQGELFCNPLTDAHEDLIELYQLKDNGMNHFIRVEFSPEDHNDLAKIECYKLEVDESSTPKWFDEELEAKVIRKLKSILKGIIIIEDRKILIDGAYIVSGCQISLMKQCRVVGVLNGGTVQEVLNGGTVQENFNKKLIFN
jgi:hypothetical protein